VTSTGLDIYSNYIILYRIILWQPCWGNCISVSTDGAPAMTGQIKGFISRLKQGFPNVGSTHCCTSQSHVQGTRSSS
jgi:hypothetical protein